MGNICKKKKRDTLLGSQKRRSKDVQLSEDIQNIQTQVAELSEEIQKLRTEMQGIKESLEQAIQDIVLLKEENKRPWENLRKLETELQALKAWQAGASEPVNEEMSTTNQDGGHSEVSSSQMPPVMEKSLLVACLNKSFLAVVSKRVQELYPMLPFKVVVHQIFLGRASTSEELDNWQKEANKVILVATASQRNMLISDVEDSQLGRYYNQSASTKDVFLMLVGHTDSISLPDHQPFAASLVQLFESQPQVGRLNDKKQFISLGYAVDPANLQFNKVQTAMLVDWIQRPSVPATCH